MDNMIDYIDDCGRLIKQKAKEVSEKVTETVEIQKFNAKIRATKREEDEALRNIGVIIYEQYKNKYPVDESIEELCRLIDIKENAIQMYHGKIAEIKKMDVCRNCGEHIEQSAVYCPICGTKKEADTEKTIDSEESVVEDTDKAIDIEDPAVKDTEKTIDTEDPAVEDIEKTIGIGEPTDGDTEEPEEEGTEETNLNEAEQ